MAADEMGRPLSGRLESGVAAFFAPASDWTSMDDWSFARPLPPGAFPDEDHLTGPDPRKRDAEPAPPQKRAESKQPG
jgi:hypothetical protein